MPDTLLFLDDQESQRRSLQLDLRALFGDQFVISALPLYPDMDQYVSEIERPEVHGVFIDQKLNETGEITNFDGIMLCEYLRTIFTTLPIYLVTAQAIDEDLKSDRVGAAEAVVSKRDLRAQTHDSRCLRQRFLRHSKRHLEALEEDQKRFRELLGKASQATLTTSEQDELNTLSNARFVATEASEAPNNKKVNEQISKIEALIQQLTNLEQS